MENNIEAPQEIKNRITIWSRNFTSGFISQIIKSRVLKRYLYTYVHSSIIPNSYNKEATQVSTSKWMDKQNMVYTYNGMLFSLKKEGNSAVCYNMMNLEDIVLTEVSQSQNGKYYMIPLIRDT